MSANNGGANLADSVRRRREQEAAGRRIGERSIGQNLAMIGAIGWLIVTPTLAGLFLGRWLDRMADTNIFWSATFLFLGVALGCHLGWRRMHYE